MIFLVLACPVNLFFAARVHTKCHFDRVFLSRIANHVNSFPLFFVVCSHVLSLSSSPNPLAAINASNLALPRGLFSSPAAVADYAALSLRAIDNLVLLKRKIVSFDERNLRRENGKELAERAMGG